MSIYKSAINRPVTTLLVFVAVIVIGIFSFLRLPIDQFPEMDPPYISVLTVYPGASASEIETNVTKIIENNLNPWCCSSWSGVRTWTRSSTMSGPI